MKKYKIYAGLGGGFGGARFEGIYEYRNQEEAERAAYVMAAEEYESYAGMHGLLDYDGIREDLEESGFIDTIDENEIDDMVDNAYMEHMESWLDYRAEEVIDDDCGLDIDHDDYDDDDADCYCE